VPLSGNVLKADGSAGDAYVEVGFAAQTNLWLTFECYVSADLRQSILDNLYGPLLFKLEVAGLGQGMALEPDGGTGPDVVWITTYGAGGDFGLNVAPNSTVLVEIHFTYTGATLQTAIFIDGLSVATRSGGFPSPSITGLRLGALEGEPEVRTIQYFDNLTVGTTRGGTDIFFDDFQGDLSGWDAETGAVSIVTNPADVPDPLDPFGLGRFYEAPPWRFIVTNLDGEILTWLDHLAFQRSITFTRGQPTVIDTGVPSDNPEINIDADDGDPFVAEGNRLVYAFRRDGGAVPWLIWASGLVLDVRDNANSNVATTTLTAYDSRQLLPRRAMLKDATGVLPDADLGLRYIGQRADEIIIEQLGLMEFWATGPLASAGLDWGQTAFYQGIIEPTPEITEITFARGVSIAEMIAKLEETGTCEVVIEAIWDPVNRPGILGELSIYERAGTTRNAAVFGYDTFPKNLVGIDRLVDGRERANQVQFYAGQGGPPVPLYDDATSMAKYGEYFAQQFFPGQVSQAAVEAMAARVLTLQKNGQHTYALSPAAERAPIPLTEYGVYDDVPVYASRVLRDPIATTLRVESIPIIIGDDQLERISGLLVAVDPEIEFGT
jgi:hypothetical protein